MIIVLFLFISSPLGLGFLFTHGEVYKFIYVQKRNKNNTTNLKVAVHEQCTHGFSRIQQMPTSSHGFQRGVW
jgi:hypothetical protein